MTIKEDDDKEDDDKEDNDKEDENKEDHIKEDDWIREWKVSTCSIAVVLGSFSYELVGSMDRDHWDRVLLMVLKIRWILHK